MTPLKKTATTRRYLAILITLSVLIVPILFLGGLSWFGLPFRQTEFDRVVNDVIARRSGSCSPGEAELPGGRRWLTVTGAVDVTCTANDEVDIFFPTKVVYWWGYDGIPYRKVYWGYLYSNKGLRQAARFTTWKDNDTINLNGPANSLTRSYSVDQQLSPHWFEVSATE